MFLEQFPDAIRTAGIPLCLSVGGVVMSVIQGKYGACDNDPASVLADALGKPTSGFRMASDGAKALGMSDDDARLLMAAVWGGSFGRPLGYRAASVRRQLLRLATSAPCE